MAITYAQSGVTYSLPSMSIRTTVRPLTIRTAEIKDKKPRHYGAI